MKTISRVDKFLNFIKNVIIVSSICWFLKHTYPCIVFLIVGAAYLYITSEVQAHNKLLNILIKLNFALRDVAADTHSLRTAQRAYLADRGNEELGATVEDYAARVDKSLVAFYKLDNIAYDVENDTLTKIPLTEEEINAL